MKTESRMRLGHLFQEMLSKVQEKYRQVGRKRFFKFVLIYGLYLTMVLSFDYLYMPWLAIKFRYLTFFPLYVSILGICLAGLLLYEFFQEDVFFKREIMAWLTEEGKHGFTKKLKGKINGNPRLMFAAIATWWSPLHAYIFFREDDKNEFSEMMKLFCLGSFYCAFFWGVVIDILVALRDLGNLIIRSYL